MTDSSGLVWQLNVYTRRVKIFVDDPLKNAILDAKVPVDVNGIKVRNEAVYITNTVKEIIARLTHRGTPS